MAYDKLFLLDIEQRDIDFWETDGTVPLGGILIMMSVDIVLYGLLAYYLDNVLPTEYGTRRKPWFPFQLSFWVSGRCSGSILSSAWKLKYVSQHNTAYSNQLKNGCVSSLPPGRGT